MSSPVAGWKRKRISELAENVFAGATPNTKISSFWENGNIPWMSSGEINNETIEGTASFITEDGFNNSSTKMVPIHSVLVALAGQGKTRGKVATNKIELCTNQSLAAIVPNQQIFYKYLYYNLQRRYVELRELSSGDGGRGGLNLKLINGISVDLPPLPEQKKIAEILSTWDEAIETNETLISLYEKYLNSLALSLVKKKILINENVWKQTKLKDVFYDRKSYGCQSDNLKLHSLTIEDGVTAKTDRYNREFLVKGDSKKYKIAKLHDLVFNPQNLRYGAIAVNSIEHDVLLSPIYATLEIKDPTKYDIGYLGYLLTSKEMISFYDSIAEGTLVERMAVKPDVFLNQVFSIPDIATQKKIANILNTFKKKIDLLKKNKAELEKQKQGLMQRLLTGKVRVKLD